MDDIERMCRESALSKALQVPDVDKKGRIKVRKASSVIKDAQTFLDFLMPKGGEADGSSS